MRRRTLAFLYVILLVAVASSIAYFAVRSRESTEQLLTEQQDAFGQFAVGIVELGLSGGRIQAVRDFLEQLAANPLVAGAVIYDEERSRMLSIPADFEVPVLAESEFFDNDFHHAGSLLYKVSPLHEEDGTVMGHLALVLSLASIDARAKDSLNAVITMGAAILLPACALIAWLLSWMEKTLRRRERSLREAEAEIALLDERRTAERERALLEKQLRQAKKMESVGTLAGGIAHDFNNLLTPILGHAELLLADLRDEDEATSSLLEIRSSASHARRLVKQLLTFSRPDPSAGRKPLLIKDIVSEALDTLATVVPPNIDVQLNVADAGAVLADATQLHQLIVNLAMNAIHAMSDGGVLGLSIAKRAFSAQELVAKPESDPGSYVVLTVSDSGSGIPPKTLERVFEPFFTTKGVGDGTGLGLAIVHGIVRAHGGFINVHSEVDVGTAFEIGLPPTDLTLSAEQSAIPTLPTASRKEARIAIIDDDRTVGRVHSALLQRFGYEVTTFVEPALGVAAVTSDPSGFDAVLTDLKMPGMSGVEVAAAIRATTSVPVILITGCGADTSASDIAAADIVEVLQKPVPLPDLLEAVHRALDARSPSTEPGVGGAPREEVA